MKTKLTTILIILLVSISNQLQTQVPLGYKGVYIKTGKSTEVREFLRDEMGLLRVKLLTEGKEEIKSLVELKDLSFDESDIKNFWFGQAIKGGVYTNISKNESGFQYALRKEMELDALSYLEKLEEFDLIFEDSYLQNYLYSIIYKIYPGSLEDGRPGILNVTIKKDLSPNAFIFPNGTLVINTGLLTTINSEEELYSVLAHEISHFVLDHSILNINKATQRQKRAEFWAGFATLAAAAAEGYTASQNQYYMPGALTYSTAILSYTIASEVTARLGLEYSQEQEIEADNCAINIMKLNKIDPTALSSVLNKIKDYCILNGDYYSISGVGTHPSIAERIKNIGAPNTFSSTNFDKTFSVIISQAAIMEFNSKHYKACQNLVNRNIKTGVATEDDYLLKAMTNLYLFNTEIKNKESLDLINYAKTLNVSPSINVFKQEALALIRLNNTQEAIIAFENYMKALNELNSEIENIKNEYTWTSTKDFISREQDWTSKMIYKLKKT